MVFRFILFLLIIAIVLRFVMRYIMPIFQMSKMAHRHMSHMRKQMEEMQAPKGAQESNRKQKKIDEEYIDYEEIK